MNPVSTPPLQFRRSRHVTISWLKGLMSVRIVLLPLPSWTKGRKSLPPLVFIENYHRFFKFYWASSNVCWGCSITPLKESANAVNNLAEILSYIDIKKTDYLKTIIIWIRLKNPCLYLIELQISQRENHYLSVSVGHKGKTSLELISRRRWVNQRLWMRRLSRAVYHLYCQRKRVFGCMWVNLAVTETQASERISIKWDVGFVSIMQSHLQLTLNWNGSKTDRFRFKFNLWQ